MSGLTGSHGERVAGGRFLDPQVLARIGNLELLARIVVEGFISGLHRAVYLGVSTDFAEHRSYSPGDDIRHIDWKLYGRTDRLYVKTFEAQTNADVMIALDVSGSMAYGPQGLSKLEYASFAAASLAHMGKRQRDRVGLATFDRGIRDYQPPSVGRHTALLQRLEHAEASGAGDLGSALSTLGARLGRRGVVVVLSDFYAEADTVVDALDELRGRGHEVIAVHILHAVERHLQLDGAPVLEDMETGERMPVVIDEVRGGYAELMQAHCDRLADLCGARGIDYEVADTGMPLDHVLFRYLSDRARRSKVR